VIRAALAGAVLAALAVSAGGRATVGSDYWLLLESNRDGVHRAYSMRPDGSLLSPLLPPGRALFPLGATPDGRTIAYTDGNEAIYVSRADGTGLRLLVRHGFAAGFSPDGKLLAFTGASDDAIRVIGTNGRGLRRLATIGESPNLHDEGPDWAPNGKALVFASDFDDNQEHYGLVLQPLRGKRRVLVRSGPAGDSDAAGIDSPNWSPDGRWIAYVNGEDAVLQNGLWLVRPDGKRRHRLASGSADSPGWSPDGRLIAFVTYDDDGDPVELRIDDPSGRERQHFATDSGLYDWSPDGTRVAFENGSDVVVAGLDGRESARVSVTGLRLDWLTWSPDGRLLLLQASDQIRAVGSDGKGLRRLTSEGENDLVGWTSVAPSRPPVTPIPPTEHVVDATTVATTAPVVSLAADGGTVAFVTDAIPTDCDHVDVWSPGSASITRFTLRAPCGYGGSHVYDVAVAGSSIAWSSYDYGRTDVVVKSPTFDHPVSLGLGREGEDTTWPTGVPDYHLRGDGDLLVESDGSSLVRIGLGNAKCGNLPCTTLRSERDGHVCCPESVSGGLIALREPHAVTVLDDQGRLVRSFTFAPDDVSAARLDGGRLVVWRFGVLEEYDVATGARLLSRLMPAGYRLADVDGGVAVLTSAGGVELLRLDDGRSLTLPGGDPTLADLEPSGLYYSYATADGGGRVVFVPRPELLRRLG
jgi:Tol biopolymer transport system component